VIISPPGKENGGFHNDSNKSQEHRLMMDLIFVLALIGFFALCVGYTYAFDRI
jgi:flagellar biogenesis protein FliO